MMQDVMQAPKIEKYEIEVKSQKRRYWVVVQYNELVERFVAKCPAWPDMGGVAGATSKDAVDNMQEVLTKHIESGAYRR